MAFKVRLASGNNFRIALNSGSQAITLKNTAVQTSRLDNLQDVSELESGKVDGALLVYDADTDKYELKPLLTYDADTNKYQFDGGGF